MRFQLLFSSILFSLARSASSSKVPGIYHDIPQADIDGFNHIFSLFIDPVNGMAKQQILKSGLDPLILWSTANVSHMQDLMICTSNTYIEYTIKDIIGLSDAKLERISVISGEKSSDGSVVLDVMGSMLPMDIHANIHGTAFTKCGFIKKTIPFDGTVMAESIKLNLVLESGAIISPADHNWHTNSTVKMIETDFNRMFYILCLIIS